MLSASGAIIVGLLLVAIPAGDRGRLIRPGWLRIGIALAGAGMIQMALILALVAVRAAASSQGMVPA